MSVSLMTCEVKHTFSKNTMFIGFLLFLLFLFSNCLLMYFANHLFILSSSIHWNNHMSDKDIMFFWEVITIVPQLFFLKKIMGPKYIVWTWCLYEPHTFKPIFPHIGFLLWSYFSFSLSQVVSWVILFLFFSSYLAILSNSLTFPIKPHFPGL